MKIWKNSGFQSYSTAVDIGNNFFERYHSLSLLDLIEISKDLDTRFVIHVHYDRDKRDIYPHQQEYLEMIYPLIVHHIFDDGSLCFMRGYELICTGKSVCLTGMRAAPERDKRDICRAIWSWWQDTILVKIFSAPSGDGSRENRIRGRRCKISRTRISLPPVSTGHG